MKRKILTVVLFTVSFPVVLIGIVAGFMATSCFIGWQLGSSIWEAWAFDDGEDLED